MTPEGQSKSPLLGRMIKDTVLQSTPVLLLKLKQFSPLQSLAWQNLLELKSDDFIYTYTSSADSKFTRL